MFSLPHRFYCQVKSAVNRGSSPSIYAINNIQETLHIFSSNALEAAKSLTIAIKGDNAEPIRRSESF